MSQFDVKTIELFWKSVVSNRFSNAKPAIEKLRSNQGLSPLLARLQLHQRLLDAIQQHLPVSMRPHCLACALDTQGRLTLYVDTAAWTSQIRFYQTSLLPVLKKIAPIQRLRLQILLPVYSKEKKAAPPRIPSPQILEQLKHNAAFVEDKEIRRALERMVHAMQTLQGRI